MTRFALVLGGGGYAGTAFHAGTITALARCGWDAQDAAVIIGTSAGAASGALVRAGFPAREYAALVLDEPLSEAAAKVMEGMARLRRAPLPALPRPVPAAPRLLLDALRHRDRRRAGVLLAAATPAGTVDVSAVSPGYGPAFARWPQRPLWITAVDLSDGSRTVFGRDRSASVADAVAASVAIPGYFTPVVLDGTRYVDGGAWSTNNADLAAGCDAELVLVSAPSGTPDPGSRDLPNLLRAQLARRLAAEVADLRRSGRRVVVFDPDRAVRRVMGANSMAAHRRGPIAMAAAARARQVLESEGLVVQRAH